MLLVTWEVLLLWVRTHCWLKCKLLGQFTNYWKNMMNWIFHHWTKKTGYYIIIEVFFKWPCHVESLLMTITMVINWKRKLNYCGFEDRDKQTSFLFAKNKAWYDNDGNNNNNNNNNNSKNKNNNKNSDNNWPVLVKQIPEIAKKINGLGITRVGRFFQLIPAFSTFWKYWMRSCQINHVIHTN